MLDQTDRCRGRARWPGRSTRLTAAAVALALAVAGCGGGDDEADPTTTTAEDTTTTTEATTTTEEVTTTTAPPEGVCEIVTDFDLDAAVHVTVEPGVETTDGDVPVCTYESADGATQATVALHDPVGELLADTLAGDPTATEPSGVADGAVLQLERGTITVQRNGKGLVITVDTDPAATEVALVQLARVGAGHLQAT